MALHKGLTLGVTKTVELANTRLAQAYLSA